MSTMTELSSARKRSAESARLAAGMGHFLIFENVPLADLGILRMKRRSLFSSISDFIRASRRARPREMDLHGHAIYVYAETKKKSIAEPK